MIDSYGREITYLRLSVTDLCNLRCRYCMPEEGVCQRPHEEMLTEDEMIQAVEAAASLGIKKLRITGGEPLVKKNIVSICRRASAVPGIEDLCLTTNGILLPELAKPLFEAGVQRINLSLDTLDPEKYAYITRRGTVEGALRGLEAALEQGFKKVKINSVLIGGFNDGDIEALAALTAKYPVDVRFIELMPMRDNPDFGSEAYLPCSAVLDKLSELVPQENDGGVARLYRLPGAMGSIGLISPLSNHFCGKCNRIRLTADGKLKSCLHSGDERSIKGLSIDDVRRVMAETITAKPACHPELSAKSISEAGRNMNQIGG
jgi:cyclic pyranopterin phosphate synthase